MYAINKATWTLTKTCKIHFSQHWQNCFLSNQQSKSKKGIQCTMITKCKAADRCMWKTRTRKCFVCFVAVVIRWWLGFCWWNHSFISLQNQSLTTLSLTSICDLLHRPTEAWLTPKASTNCLLLYRLQPISSVTGIQSVRCVINVCLERSTFHNIINRPKSWTDELQPAQRGLATFNEDVNQPPLRKHFKLTLNQKIRLQFLFDG